MNLQTDLFDTPQDQPPKVLGAQPAVVVLSGGQDSTTCLFWAKLHGFDIHAFTVDYSQRHSVEIECAKKVAKRAGVLTHEVLPVGPILQGTSPLVSHANLEEYKDCMSLPGGLEKTFVPMRNQFFLTLAANRAATKGAVAIITGVCEEDYGGYPDCRSSFIDALQLACNRGTFTGEDGAPDPLTILTPLMKLSKAESVHLALRLPGCYSALAWTHTGYAGEYPPVTKDHATLLREKGFLEAGVPDPLILRAFHDGLGRLPSTPNYSVQAVGKALEILESENWLEA